MTASLARIFRHPVKSIGFEEIRNASLSEGRVLPFDRIWAISTMEARFDSPLSDWAPKRDFVRGAAAPGLMAVAAHTHNDGSIEFTHPDLWHLRVDLDTPADQAKLIAWLKPLWPENRPAPRAVEKPGLALTDSREAFVSILSLDSLDDLSARSGKTLSPPRFRGNLWLRGMAPWAERDLVGQRLRIGTTAEIEIVEPITRCRATCASPETGTEDFNTLGALKEITGDTTFGLFGLVRRAGEIARDDAVEVLP